MHSARLLNTLLLTLYCCVIAESDREGGKGGGGGGVLQYRTLMAAHLTGTDIVLSWYELFFNIELSSYENTTDSCRTYWPSISLQSTFTFRIKN
jgi:hypothetical protein